MIAKIQDMETNQLLEIVNYLVAHYTNVSTGTIKEKFDLSEDAYRDAFELAMIAIRSKNDVIYWRMSYMHLTSQIGSIIYRCTIEKKFHPSKAFEKINKMIVNQNAKIKERELAS